MMKFVVLALLVAGGKNVYVAKRKSLKTPFALTCPCLLLF